MTEELNLFSPVAKNSRERNKNAYSDFIAIYSSSEHGYFDCYDMLVDSNFGYGKYLQGLMSEYEGRVSGIERLAIEYDIQRPKKEAEWRSFSVQMFCTYGMFCLGFTDSKKVKQAMRALLSESESDINKFTSLVISITKKQVNELSVV